MKTIISTIISVLGLFLLVGCGKNTSISESSPANISENTIKKIEKPTIPPIIFERESELVAGLGMVGGGDPLLMKKLGTSIGGQIEIKKMYVWSYDGTDWEKGGKFHIMNDDSMGRAYSVKCSVSSEIGDKFMETKNKRDVSIVGTIANYSSSNGLVIDPCTATWESSSQPTSIVKDLPKLAGECYSPPHPKNIVIVTSPSEGKIYLGSRLNQGNLELTSISGPVSSSGNTFSFDIFSSDGENKGKIQFNLKEGIITSVDGKNSVYNKQCDNASSENYDELLELMRGGYLAGVAKYKSQLDQKKKERENYDSMPNKF